MSIYIEKLHPVVDTMNPEWLLYEHGSYQRPICILRYAEVLELLGKFATAHPDAAKNIVADATKKVKAPR